jgi:chromosome partitioning protein
MRIIAVANQKGGCGKTTVAINLSACLAREGRRTLLIDLDPQGHCALGLAVPEEQIERSIADVLLDPQGLTGVNLARITWQISNNLDLAPSKTDLAELEQRLAGVEGREQRLRQVLDSLDGGYDFVVIDSPPSIGFLTQSMLHAADEVVVPVDTGYFALHGLSKQVDTLRDIASHQSRPMILRILPNLYDVRTKLAREILAELRKRYPEAILKSFVNFNTKLKEATSFGQPITEYDPASIGSRDFVALAREIVALGQSRVSASILEQAEAITAEAERLLSTSRSLLGTEEESDTSLALSDEGTNGFARMTAARGSASLQVVSPPQRSAAALAVSDFDRRETDDDPLFEPRPVQEEAPPASKQHPTPRETQRKIDRLYGVLSTDDGVIFAVRAPGARHVRLAGDFNGWNCEITPMRRVGDESFEVRLPLGPGRYQYRYVIDGHWLNDPHNDLIDWNPFGERNNVVIVR